MAPSAKTSEEQPIRSDGPEPQSSRQDTAMPSNDEDEENNIANVDTEEDLENYKGIWEAEKAGEGYYVPIYIWCASVIFPLCAGSFGPMASAFGICALAESWRVDNVNKAGNNMLVGTDIEDPKWRVTTPSYFVVITDHVYSAVLLLQNEDSGWKINVADGLLFTGSYLSTDFLSHSRSLRIYPYYSQWPIEYPLPSLNS